MSTLERGHEVRSQSALLRSRLGRVQARAGDLDHCRQARFPRSSSRPEIDSDAKSHPESFTIRLMSRRKFLKASAVIGAGAVTRRVCRRGNGLRAQRRSAERDLKPIRILSRQV